MTALHYPHGDTLPPPGETIEVADGVRWLRMPLPFALDHINLWLVDDGDGWTIVDCGLNSDTTKSLWPQVLAHAGGRPVTRVFTTHFHPDHMGLAGWLCAEHGVEMWTTRTEWMMARSLFLDAEDANRREMAEFYRANGVPEAWYENSIATGNTYRRALVEPPARFRRVADRQRVEIGGRSWEVRVGEGHAPEHAALHCAEIGTLISGDHILPRISPHIGLWASEPGANPLNDYVESIETFRDLPADTLVLPSHVTPFTGLHDRIQDIQDHHRDRLDKLRQAIADTPITAYEAIPHMFGRQFEDFHLGLAMGECLAHLAFLEKAGAIVGERGDDGVRRFRRAR
jgi:glyoxylase-like metal-dependent hydrolase (beta-lactamase superfamily II)